MRFKVVIIVLILGLSFKGNAQGKKAVKFSGLSCPEKWWVIWHPFKAKKAKEVTVYAREITDSIKNNKVLIGTGNGGQVDAFRHAFWMASLTQEIGWRSAQKLGKAHEKGNYRQFKKGKSEDGSLPDRVASKMDLYNNFMGMIIGLSREEKELIGTIVLLTKEGHFKIIKRNQNGEFLDENDAVIPMDELKGEWENRKCLVPSNYSGEETYQD